MFAKRITWQVTKQEMNLTDAVVNNRPPPIRDFDQIHMKSGDMLMQTRLMAPYVTDKEVVFMGDGDSMSLMFGLFGQEGLIAPPKHMRVLDFDKRILNRIKNFAESHGFGHMVEVHSYNVFDSLPEILTERADFFYTNPPYGSKNEGLSGIAFIDRGAELCKRTGISGCLILPYDHNRRWAQTAMRRIQAHLVQQGFIVSEMIQQLHTYWLEDNPVLASSVVIVDRLEYATSRFGRGSIPMEEVPNFYGESVTRVPHYISESGEPDYDWG